MVNDNQMSGSNSITIFHQIICGLKEKTDKLISLCPQILPIFCVFLNTTHQNLPRILPAKKTEATQFHYIKHNMHRR